VRTVVAKAFVALYLGFNSQLGFPRVLRGMAGGNAACSLPFVLRYINAQPCLTASLVSMARPLPALRTLLKPSLCCCPGQRSLALSIRVGRPCMHGVMMSAGGCRSAACISCCMGR
jgi:hypothetical protein